VRVLLALLYAWQQCETVFRYSWWYELEHPIQLPKFLILIFPSYIVTCSEVCVTYKTGFGLNDRIYCTLYIHTTGDYKQYSAIAMIHTFQFTVTHTLGFSVFTSRILATDLSQSHFHFKSHINSSWYSLIPFLPFLLNHLYCHLQKSVQFLILAS
jgi:hypothetical protein